ncbi:MAG: cupin domain-containing protein [Chloroflexi bacterium]|nr:cupin domain-containing protein [Chloroflexota bacterium]
MDAFEFSELVRQQDQSGERYLEFLTVPTMSLGVYSLPAGGVDTQQPHTEDEIYYIVSGRSTISVDGEDRPVEPGSVVFVGAHVDHRFHTITEDMTILVVFAPARGSQA